MYLVSVCYLPRVHLVWIITTLAYARGVNDTLLQDTSFMAHDQQGNWWLEQTRRTSFGCFFLRRPAIQKLRRAWGETEEQNDDIIGKMGRLKWVLEVSSTSVDEPDWSPVDTSLVYNTARTASWQRSTPVRHCWLSASFFDSLATVIHNHTTLALLLQCLEQYFFNHLNDGLQYCTATHGCMDEYQHGKWRWHRTGKLWIEEGSMKTKSLFLNEGATTVAWKVASSLTWTRKLYCNTSFHNRLGQHKPL